MTPERVDECARVGEVPERKVRPRAGREGSDFTRKAEGAGRVHGGPENRLLGPKSPEAHRQMERQKKTGGEGRSGVEVGRDGHGDARAAERRKRRAGRLGGEVGRDGQENGHGSRGGEGTGVRFRRLLEVVAGERPEGGGAGARSEGVELFTVGAEPEAQGACGTEETLHVLETESEGLDIDVDETRETPAGDFREKLRHDRLEVGVPALLGRNGVGGQAARNRTHAGPGAERRDEREKTQLLGDVESVAALHLDRRHPLAGESGEARGRNAQETLVVRRTHRAHGGEESSAGTVPSGIIVSVETREILFRAVAGEEGVRMAVDEPRKKKPTAGVEDPPGGARRRHSEGAHAPAVDRQRPPRMRGEPLEEGVDAGVDHEEIVHGHSAGGGSGRLAFRHVLTPEGFVTDTALVLDGTGRIVALEPAEPPWDGWCALPAMVSAHSHAFHRLLTGLGERAVEAGSFWSWRALMYRAAERLTPADLEAVATVTYEALRAGGYGAVGEFHYLHRDARGELSTKAGEALARAAARVGIRLVLIPALYQRGGYGRAAAGAQERFLTPEIDSFLDYAAALPGAGRAVAVHSLRAVEPACAADFVARARRRFGADCRLHIHAAEQLSEVEEVRRHEGRGPIEVLEERGLLDTRTAVVHATHASAEERALLARRGARVVLCPQTEAYLGDGLFPLGAFQDKGGDWTLGTDANVRTGAWDELRLLEQEARLLERRRVCLAPGPGLARTLWSRAARAGAHVLALPSGEIRPGAWADLFVLDPGGSPWTTTDPQTFLDACLLGDETAEAALYVGGRRRSPLGARDPVSWHEALARFRRLQEELAR